MNLYPTQEINATNSNFNARHPFYLWCTSMFPNNFRYHLKNLSLRHQPWTSLAKALGMCPVTYIILSPWTGLAKTSGMCPVTYRLLTCTNYCRVSFHNAEIITTFTSFRHFGKLHAHQMELFAQFAKIKKHETNTLVWF